MLDPSNIPAVHPSELLARYVLFSRHIRSDKTIKPDAFIPHPNIALSLTRHLEATTDEIWQEGQRVASVRGVKLYGRADVGAGSIIEQGLSIKAAPIDENSNHVDVLDWPTEKSEQKIKAMQIAAQSKYRAVPLA